MTNKIEVNKSNSLSKEFQSLLDQAFKDRNSNYKKIIE